MVGPKTGDSKIVTGDEISHIIRAAAGALWVLLAAFVVWLRASR